MPKLSRAFGDPDHPPVTYDEGLAFIDPVMLDALAYWNERRAGRTMPRPSDIDLSIGLAFVPYASLVEVMVTPDGQVDYFVRVSGPRVEEVLGPRTGKLLLDGIPPEMVLRWRNPFDFVYHTARPLRGAGRLAFQGKDWLETENLYAPLGEEGAPPTAMFCAFVAKLVDQNRA